MKKIAFAAITLLASLMAIAQCDTAQLEQYCQVIATPRLFSNKVTIAIDLGEERSFWADNRLRTYDGRLKKFNTIIDALNFMGKEGWRFINAFPVRSGQTEVYHFGFKRLFLRQEIQ